MARIAASEVQQLAKDSTANGAGIPTSPLPGSDGLRDVRGGLFRHRSPEREAWGAEALLLDDLLFAGMEDVATESSNRISPDRGARAGGRVSWEGPLVSVGAFSR